MIARQFDRKASAVLEKYGKYNIADHKVWREKDQIFFSAKFNPGLFRTEPWGVSAVFTKDGKLIRSSCGSRRDSMFTRILMRRIEEACLGPKKNKEIQVKRRKMP